MATIIENLLWELKDIFTLSYTDLKGIPPHSAKHYIKLDTTILLAHQVQHRMNPNYATVVKQDLNKLLVIGFTKLVETSHMVVVNYGCVEN
jgi:5-bromo-4-chloroindolyl phosphate hydrolysis protein